MVFCHKCGTKAIEDAGFCQKCGAKLVKDANEKQVAYKADINKPGKAVGLVAVVILVLVEFIILVSLMEYATQRHKRNILIYFSDLIPTGNENISVTQTYANEAEEFPFKFPDCIDY